MYRIVHVQCSDATKKKLEAYDLFVSIHKNMDTIELLNLINTLTSFNMEV